jgi:diguanylate cyclase (GGDEF)-like protein
MNLSHRVAALRREHAVIGLGRRVSARILPRARVCWALFSQPSRAPSRAPIKAFGQPFDRLATPSSLHAVLRGLLLFGVAILALAASLHALDPQKQIDQYGHDNWTSQHGLPGEAVYQILQTRDGYLWLRIGSGLVRFDGVRFVSMDAEFGSEPVKAICIGADGDLLIRTATRTLIYKDRQFSDYRPPARLPGGAVRVLFESREHVVFVGTDNFIYRIERDGKVATLRGRTAWISVFFEDHAGRIWIAGTDNIFLYQNNAILGPLNKNGHPSLFSALIEDRDHRIWAATREGLYELHAEGPLLGSALPKGPALLTTLLKDRQGNLWAGTEKTGVIRIVRDGTPSAGISSLGFQEGLTDDNVFSLFEDREGSIWIGTASGLDRLRDTKLTTITTNEGIPSNREKSAIAMRDGSVEVFSDNGGLSNIRNGSATPFKHNNQLPTPYGSALFESQDGSLWVGAYGGLTLIQGGKVTVYDGGGHLSKAFISAISEDDEGLIVTNSESRAFRFKNGKILPFTLRGKTTDVTDSGIYTFSIDRDPAGTLWFGTTKGLFKLPAAGGPGAGFQLKETIDITNIFNDGRGYLWLGGRTPGILRFRISDGLVTRYTEREGLFDGYASRILAGDDGNFWISAEDGIYSVSSKELDEVAEDRRQSVSSTHYGLADGMKTTEASDASSQPGGCRTPDGKLWFATKKGIVEVDPAHMIHNDFIPPVIVESVAANGIVQPSGSDLQLAPGKKNIEIHYTALSLRIPERVRFKYRLEGYENEWVDAGARRVAYYTNLPPGQYAFRVIAANDDGVWNLQGASVSFVLKPRFYQTNWFYLVCLLLLILIVFAGNRITTRLIRARADQLARLVEEKTAELLNSQKELEQLANFDSLTALPNRRHFSEDFDRMCAQETGDEFTLLLIDVDDFKAINDTYGHDAGDAVLVETSNRLQSAVRSTDQVARLGGDEFSILLIGRRDEEWLRKICDRIVESFSVPVTFNDVTIRATVSVGVASYPKDGDTQEKLYKSADIALYEAKRLGRNNWQKYRSELQQEL